MSLAPETPRARNRRVLTVTLVVGVLVGGAALSLVGWGVANGAASVRERQELNQLLEQRIDGADASSRVQAIEDVLADGARRLPVAWAHRHAANRLEILEEAGDEPTCSALLTGSRSFGAEARGLALLEWKAVRRQMLRAALKEEPIVVVERPDLLLRTFWASLPEAQRQRFLRVDFGICPEPRECCWAGRILYRYALTADDFALALVQGLFGPP